MKIVVLLSALLLLAAVTSHAQKTVQLIWSYDLPVTETIYGPNGTTPLAGNATTNGGTGFVLQLGYYTGATSSNPFLGTWVPVFGPGTSNSLFTAAGMGTSYSNGTSGTIGSTGTDDRFSFTGTITDSTPNTEIGIPSAGQIMSIRYYNATTVAGATDYGAISDPSGGSAWLWESPSDPAPAGMSFSFFDTGVTYQGGASEPETNIATSAVPEPATLSLFGGIIILGASALRRKQND